MEKAILEQVSQLANTVTRVLSCILQLQEEQERMRSSIEKFEENGLTLKYLLENCQQMATVVEEMNCRVLNLEDPVKTS